MNNKINTTSPFDTFIQSYILFMDAWIRALSMDSLVTGNNNQIDYYNVANDRRWDGSKERRKALL